MCPRESLKSKQERAVDILDTLEETHPDARIFLDYDGPFELLIATILSAQCTDERVNQTTPELFEKYPDAKSMAEADPEDIKETIQSLGFYNQKTRSVMGCCRALVEEHGGEVPADMDALTDIRGVGRKTASVVLAGAFDLQAIPVDTHVKRVSTRLGLASGKNADKIERQLREVLPEGRWSRGAMLIGTHGRRICHSRKPDCANCPVRHLCAYYAKQEA